MFCVQWGFTPWPWDWGMMSAINQNQAAGSTHHLTENLLSELDYPAWAGGIDHRKLTRASEGGIKQEGESSQTQKGC